MSERTVRDELEHCLERAAMWPGLADAVARAIGARSGFSRKQVRATYDVGRAIVDALVPICEKMVEGMPKRCVTLEAPNTFTPSIITARNSDGTVLDLCPFIDHEDGAPHHFPTAEEAWGYVESTVILRHGHKPADVCVVESKR